MIEGLYIDLHRAWRAWRRQPTTALAVIVLSALGIGGVAAFFTPLYSLVLVPLPFPQPDQLVRIGGDIPLFNVYSATFEQPERLSRIFANVSAYAPATEGTWTQLGVAGRYYPVNVEAVTPEFFEALGVRPGMGTGFARESPATSGVVVSARLWENQLGRAPDVVGTAVQLGQQSRVVVGVMPTGFDFPPGTDIWVPIRTIPYHDAGLQLLGRLRSGFTLARAATDLKAIGLQRGGGPSGRIGKEGPVLQTLHGYLHGDRRSLLLVLSAVSLLFLLLASAGTVNLLMAHGVRRRAEIGLHLAFGASRLRLVRQMLTETLLVVTAGGAFGLLVSVVGGRWLRVQLPAMGGSPVFAPATVALGAVLVVVVTIGCGIGPALFTTESHLNLYLRSGTDDPHLLRRRLLSPRECFAVAQLAIALALVIGTGLLLRSLSGRVTTPLGLETEHVSVIRADLLPLASLEAARKKFYAEHGMDRFGNYGPRDAQLLESLRSALEPHQKTQYARNAMLFSEADGRLGRLPEVAAVGVFNPAPFTPEALRAMQVSRDVYRSNPTGAAEMPLHASCVHGQASGNAFDLLGIPLKAGRTFTPDDAAAERAMGDSTASCQSCSSSPGGVAIINETLARRFWPNQNPIGKEFFDSPSRRRTVVGVVANFHLSGDDMREMPAVYYPFTGAAGRSYFVVKLRPEASVKQFSEAATRVMSELGPAMSVVAVDTLDRLTAEPLRNLRLALRMLTCFSTLGTIVSGLGVYAVAALTMAARRRELAVRMALGAKIGQIRLLALWRSLRLAVLGLPVGLLAGWALALSLSHWLFQVTATDPTSYLTGTALLLVVVVCGGLGPALAATSAASATNLRHE